MQIRRRYSDPRIGNAHHGLASFREHSQANGAPAFGVFGGVGKQVGEHLRQPVEVSIDGELLGGRLHDQLMAMLVDRRPAGFGAGGQHLTQTHPIAPQIDLAGADPADIEEVVDEMHQVVELPIHDLDGTLEG
jgi:hypothetical protein